jgi:hypothetical protein
MEQIWLGFWSAIINANPVLLSGLAFFAGILLGNWIAIGRDKRNEYNQAVIPLRERLLEDVRRPTRVS